MSNGGFVILYVINRLDAAAPVLAAQESGRGLTGACS